MPSPHSAMARRMSSPSQHTDAEPETSPVLFSYIDAVQHMPSRQTPEGQSAQGSDASLLVSIGCVAPSLVVVDVVVEVSSLPPAVPAEPPPLRPPSPPASAAHAHAPNKIHPRNRTRRASALLLAAGNTTAEAAMCRWYGVASPS